MFDTASQDESGVSRISEEKLAKLLTYLLSKCYKQPSFTLHADLVYICLVLQKGYEQFKYLKIVEKHLCDLYDQIQTEGVALSTSSTSF